MLTSFIRRQSIELQTKRRQTHSTHQWRGNSRFVKRKIGRRSEGPSSSSGKPKNKGRTSRHPTSTMKRRQLEMTARSIRHNLRARAVQREQTRQKLTRRSVSIRLCRRPRNERTAPEASPARTNTQNRQRLEKHFTHALVLCCFLFKTARLNKVKQHNVDQTFCPLRRRHYAATASLVRRLPLTTICGCGLKTNSNLKAIFR